MARWLIAAAVLAATDVDAQPTSRDRGPYASVLLTGAEVEGPKPTADTDLGTFTGVGFAAAAGYRWLPLRLELEYHANTARSYAYSDDRIALRSLMLNAVAEAQLVRWFGVFAGFGYGQARVKVDLTTCLQPAGCPAFFSSHTSGSAAARQIELGVAFGPFAGQQVLLGWRELRSSALGLTDTQGRAFEKDRADFRMGFIGWRGNF